MRKIVALAMLAGLGLFTPALAKASKDEAAGTVPTKILAVNVDQVGYGMRSVRERDDKYHANLVDCDTAKTVHAEFRVADGELMSARVVAKDKERLGHERERDEVGRGKDDHETYDRD